MKKIIAIMAVLSACVASADYLYWLMDTDEADAFAASLDKSWDTAKLVVINGNSLDPVTYADAFAQPLATFTRDQVDGSFGWATSLGDGYTFNSSDNYSFLVELYNENDWVAQSSAMSFMAGASYVGSGSIYNPASGTYTPTGFNVPEPTSGLLMLVGGMLLALKRRKMA